MFASFRRGGPAASCKQVSARNDPTAAVGNATTFTAVEVWSDASTHTPPAGTQIDWTSGTVATAKLANASSTTTNTNTTLALAAGTTVITATEPGTTITGTTTLTVVTGSAHFAYVSVANAHEVQWYTVSATSATPFTSAGTQSINGGAALPQQEVLHPSNSYLYVIDVSSDIYRYTVNASTGALTSVGTVVLGGATGDNQMVIDPYGRFMYVTDDGGGTSPATIGGLAGFTISQTDGSLTGISGMTPTGGNPTPFTTNLTNPTGMVIDRTGTYLYVLNNGTSSGSGLGVAAFSIDQTSGALTPLSTATFDTGNAPFYGNLDPTGKFLYVANSNDATNPVSQFSIGSGGLLTAIGSAVTTTPANTSIFNVTVDKTGKYIYLLDAGAANGLVYVFNLGTNGVVGTQIGTPANTDVGPAGNIVIDPTNALMAVDNNISDDISLFQVKSDGTLTSLTPVAAGSVPSIPLIGNAPLWVIYYMAP